MGMETLSERPLVSIGLFVYNSENYVREAVRGMLSQTYSPLEIVISDDGSTDRTWEIINEECSKFCGHKVILSRNKHNLGAVRNFEKMASFCHGELVVCCAGDDVSMPNRVSRIVDEWLLSGKRARLIHTNCVVVNMNGEKMKSRYGYFGAFHPRGSLAAFSHDVLTSFPPVSRTDAYEDRPYACRAAILNAIDEGCELFIDEDLVLYRVGNGASTSVGEYRDATIRSLNHSIAGCEQNEIDIMLMQDRLTENDRKSLMDKMMSEKSLLVRRRNLLRGDSIVERFRCRQICNWTGAVKNFLLGHFGRNFGEIYEFLCVLPKCIGTPLLQIYVDYLYRRGLVV